MLDSVHRVPEKTETTNEGEKKFEKKEEVELLHTPIKYNQEASLKSVVFIERRRGGILAYL